jgi:hypothetical protein
MTHSTKPKRPQARQHRSPLTVPLILLAVVLLLVVGGYILSAERSNTTASSDTNEHSPVYERSGVELPHIHGLGFSDDGRQLFVAAHTGLRVFVDGTWNTPNIPPHDYMGYSSTDDGFYSSGHPGTRGLINPFGLIKSTDGGKTLTELGFEGESDFHVMGVGYKSHTIYVLNLTPNSKLPVGLHYSLDDGKTWKQSAMRGITARPIQIAVHPTDSNILALATEGGLFLSGNAGVLFERVGPPGAVSATIFSPDGAKLVFGNTSLWVYDLATKNVTDLPLPANAHTDGVLGIAINPVRPTEIAVATFERNMYLSQDGGQSWSQIARSGLGLPIK